MWNLADPAQRYAAAKWLNFEHGEELRSDAEDLLAVKSDNFESGDRDYVSFVISFLRCAIWIDDFIPVRAGSIEEQRKALMAHARTLLDKACDDIATIEQEILYRGGFAAMERTLLIALSNPSFLKKAGDEVKYLNEARTLLKYEDSGGYDQIVRELLGESPNPKEKEKLLSLLRQKVRRARAQRDIDILRHMMIPDLKRPYIPVQCISPREINILVQLWKYDRWHRLCCAQTKCGVNWQSVKENAKTLLGSVMSHIGQHVTVENHAGFQVKPAVWNMIQSRDYSGDRERLLRDSHPDTGLPKRRMSKEQYEFIHYIFKQEPIDMDKNYLNYTCSKCQKYHFVAIIVVIERKAEHYLKVANSVSGGRENG